MQGRRSEAQAAEAVSPPPPHGSLSQVTECRLRSRSSDRAQDMRRNDGGTAGCERHVRGIAHSRKTRRAAPPGGSRDSIVTVYFQLHTYFTLEFDPLCLTVFSCPVVLIFFELSSCPVLYCCAVFFLVLQWLVSVSNLSWAAWCQRQRVLCTSTRSNLRRLTNEPLPAMSCTMKRRI